VHFLRCCSLLYHVAFKELVHFLCWCSLLYHCVSFCRCLLSVFCLFWFVLAYYPLQHMQRSYWGCHKSLRKIFLRTGIRVSASVFWQKTSDLYNRIIMVPEQLLNCFLRWLVLNVKCEPPRPPLQEEKIVINIYKNIKYDLRGEQINRIIWT
jgi:hypothetical protein